MSIIKKSHMKYCEYCGNEKFSKGFPAHEKACKRQHQGVKLADRRRSPTFMQPTTRTFTVEVPDHPAPPSSTEMAAGTEMQQALAMFPTNSALFAAQLHILLAKSDDDPIPQLRRAQAMLEAEINRLGG